MCRLRDDWIKIPNFVEDLIPMQLHQQFVRYFRMGITSAYKFIDKVASYYQTRAFPGGRQELSIEKKVLMILNYLGSRETGFT